MEEEYEATCNDPTAKDEGVGSSDLLADNKRLRMALEEISKGEGRYSMDRLMHATNTIEDMKEIAIKALLGS